MILALFVVGCGVSGAALLALGVRGRRVNDHPHCGRCRFDLSGLDLDADDAACPECGAGLHGERAVRIGMRSPRRAVAGLGGLLTLLALLGAGGVVYIQATGVNWDRIVPAGALVSQIPRADAEREAVILAELARRLEDDILPDRALARAAAMAVERQQDFSRLWSDEWRDFIGAAWTRGVLSDEQKISVLQSTIEIGLQTRDRVRHGDAISLGLSFDFGARRPRQFPELEIRIDPVDLMLDGEPVETNPPGRPYGMCGLTRDTMLGEIGFGASGLNASIPAPDASGERMFSAKLRIRVYDEGQIPGEPRQLTRDITNAGDPILEWTQPAATSTIVLEPGEETIALVVDDDLRSEVQAGISASDGATTPHNRGGRWLNVVMRIEKAPVSLSFIAWARRASGEEIRLGNVYAPVAHIGLSGYSHHVRGRVDDDFTDDSIDIILRPDRRPVRDMREFTEIWGEEIVIRDVEIEHRSGDD